MHIGVDSTHERIHICVACRVIPMDFGSGHGRPIGSSRSGEQSHCLNVQAFVDRKAVFDPGRKGDKSTCGCLHTDPFVVHVTDIKVSTPVNNVADLVTSRVDMFFIVTCVVGGHNDNVGVLVIIFISEFLEGGVIGSIDWGRPGNFLHFVGVRETSGVEEGETNPRGQQHRWVYEPCGFVHVGHGRILRVGGRQTEKFRPIGIVLTFGNDGSFHAFGVGHGGVCIGRRQEGRQEQK
mmetsp:Transcript_26020/g.38541  ORF Transcript_26020/g.38541 Transcript_26020/m.38541 type:complete len:236 (+) Transcript_26020:181-888(+)